MNKTITSVFAGIGGMLGWGTSDFFASISSGKVGHFKTFFWSQLAGIIFILFLLPVFGINLNLSLLFIILLLIASIFYAAAYLLFYKAFEIGSISIISSTINLYAVFTMIFAFIFLGQRLSSLQFSAVIMIIIGVTLITLKFSDLKNKKIALLAGVKEALLSSLLFGIYWTLSDVISGGIGWFATTLFVKIGAVIFLLSFALFVKKKLSLAKINAKTKFIVCLVGILEAMGVASVNWGLAIGDVILVSPIASALSVVTILMAIIFLKEKINLIQGMGLIMVISGIILAAF